MQWNCRSKLMTWKSRLSYTQDCHAINLSCCQGSLAVSKVKLLRKSSSQAGLQHCFTAFSPNLDQIQIFGLLVFFSFCWKDYSIWVPHKMRIDTGCPKSKKSVYTLDFVISQILDKVQRKFRPFSYSPGDADSKIDLTFLLTWKNDQVTAQNVKQTEFWKYYFDGRF